MVTVSHIVKKLIEKNPFLLEGLSKGIISNGNLAEELKPKIELEIGKKVKDASIIMALRRYSEQIKLKEKPKKLIHSELIMKTNICDYNIIKNPDILLKIKSLYKIVDLERGDFLNIIVGNNEIAISINEKHKAKVEKFLEKEKILSKKSNLVAITILFTGDFIHTPGIIFQTVRKLAWENINIFEIISTLTELTFIVRKKDSIKAYEVLQELLN